MIRARPDVMRVLHVHLEQHHRGAAKATTWAKLRDLLAERLGEPTIAVRRAQEAVAALVAQGDPIVAVSDRGVWWSETVAELDAGIRELDHRLAGTGKRKAALRAIRRRMVGSPQMELPTGDRT